LATVLVQPLVAHLGVAPGVLHQRERMFAQSSNPAAPPVT
jgi:hypothetical protein